MVLLDIDVEIDDCMAGWSTAKADAYFLEPREKNPKTITEDVHAKSSRNFHENPNRVCFTKKIPCSRRVRHFVKFGCMVGNLGRIYIDFARGFLNLADWIQMS